MTLNLTNEERIFIYDWFRNLLGQELSDKQLQDLQAGKFEPFLSFMTELGFANYTAKFRQELTACMLYQHPRLELAADYAQLFLLDGQNSALPYASAYLEGDFLDQHLAEMDGYLQQFKLGINKVKNEPSDHLCVYLEVLIKLIETNSLSQSIFIKENLLSWLPSLHEKTNKVKTQRQLYQTLLEWLVAFLKTEIR